MNNEYMFIYKKTGSVKPILDTPSSKYELQHCFIKFGFTSEQAKLLLIRNADSEDLYSIHAFHGLEFFIVLYSTNVHNQVRVCLP